MNKNLPKPVAAYLAAVNRFDLDGILGTFADDALVNDARREFWGRAAIATWAAKELVGDRVTIEVTEVVNHYDAIIVRGRYDGLYDKTNLPAELILTSYFRLRGEKLVELIILHNRPAA